MKVGIVINSLGIGGAEKLVADSISLVNEKVECAELVVLKEQESFLANQLNAEGVCPVYLTKGSLYNPFLFLALISVLKRNDVVHFHLFPTLYWVVLASLLVRKKPYLIYTEHNTHNKRRDSRFFAFLDRLVYGRIDRIVAITDEVQQQLEAHLGSRFHSKLTVINNGINLEAIENAVPYPKAQLGFQQSDVLVLQVSSFRWQKDHTTLVNAMRLLPANYHLLCAGDGVLKNDIQNLVKQLDLEHRVHFLGNRDDVPQLLKTADAIVLSSHHEGLSLSSLEAMASGNPFIGSDVAGLREIVKGYGLLFEKGNSQDLARQILHLEQDCVFRASVVEACRSRAHSFDIRGMADAYCSLYALSSD